MPAPTVDIAGYRHGQVPRRIREAQVLALSEQLFAERGYQGVTMNELAARAGVTKPVIYALVRSKDELYRRCFQRAADELADSVTAAVMGALGDLGEMLRAGNLAFFRFIESHAGAFAMLFAEETGGRLAAHVARMRERQAQLLQAVLVERAAEAGTEVDGQRIALAAHVVNGAAEALAHWWRGNPELRAEELAERLTELLLPGLRQLVEG